MQLKLQVSVTSIVVESTSRMTFIYLSRIIDSTWILYTSDTIQILLALYVIFGFAC